MAEVLIFAVIEAVLFLEWLKTTLEINRHYYWEDSEESYPVER